MAGGSPGVDVTFILRVLLSVMTPTSEMVGGTAGNYIAYKVFQYWYMQLPAHNTTLIAVARLCSLHIPLHTMIHIMTQ